MASKVQKSKLLEAQIKEGQKELLEKARTARLRIQKRIDDAIARQDFILAANVRNTLYKQVAAEYVRLNRGVDDWVDERAMTVSKAWHMLAIDDIPEGTGATFGQFSKKYFDDIVGKINPATIDKRVGVNVQIGGMLNSDIRAIRTAVSETIRKGALTGMNNIELTAEMKRAAESITAGAKFVDKAGKTWNSDSYFGMLNRTIHSNVARETYNSTVVDAGFDLVQVNGRSTYPDSPCIPFEGEILSLTGETKGYMTVSEAESEGLFHPNCVHTTSVYIPDADEKQTYQEKIEQANTISEANTAAEDILGLSSANYKGLSLESANKINAELLDIKNKYGLGTMDSLTIVKNSKFSAKMDNGKKLIINAGSANNSSATVYPEGYFAGKSGIIGVINHEVGHSLTPNVFSFEEGVKSMTPFGKKLDSFFIENKDRIEKELSTYGATARHEFVAEAFAGMRNNTAPKWIIDFMVKEVLK